MIMKKAFIIVSLLLFAVIVHSQSDSHGTIASVNAGLDADSNSNPDGQASPTGFIELSNTGLNNPGITVAIVVLVFILLALSALVLTRPKA